MRDKASKRQNRKRLFSVVLTLAMILTLAPLNSVKVYAADYQIVCGEIKVLKSSSSSSIQLGGSSSNTNVVKVNTRTQNGEKQAYIEGISAGDATVTISSYGNYGNSSSTSSVNVRHNYGDWINYNNAANHKRTCSGNSNHVEYQNHAWNSSTGKCNTCGYECLHTGQVAMCSTCGKELHVCSVGDLQLGQVATCISDGWNNYYICECGKVYETTTLSNSYDNLDEWKVSPAGKISKLGHEWNYSSDSATLKASCTRKDTCGQEDVSLTLSATSLNYTGNSVSPVSIDKTAWENAGLIAPTIKYYDIAGCEGQPVNAGTYMAKISPVGVTATEDNTAVLSCYVSKAAQTATGISMTNYSFNGDVSEPVVNGASENPIITWYYGSDSSSIINAWNPETMKTLALGLYYVKADLDETTNYNTQTVVGTFKVNKGVKTAPDAITATDDGVITIAETDREKKLEYSLNNTNWATVNLKSDGTFTITGLTESTTYNVYVREKGDSTANASSTVNTSFTTSAKYSVAYDANGGVGNVPEAQTANSGSNITVSNGNGLTKKGYTFSGWNTSKDGSGTAKIPNDSISYGATLYAQWTANSYSVKFDANGGEGEMPEQNFTYDVAQSLIANSFTKDSYSFAGWAISKNGAAIYKDLQNVKNIKTSGNVTLYAAWTQNVYTLTTSISSNSNTTATVKLMKGNTIYATGSISSFTGTNPYSGTNDFTNAVPGIYDVVVTQIINGKTITMTKLAIITDASTTVDIIMPMGDTSSKLEVTGADTPQVVVDGLAEEATTKAQINKSVTVVMTIEKQEEQTITGVATEKEIQTQTAIASIKGAASGKSLDYMSIDVEQLVKDSGGIETKDAIIETNNVCEIVIPYDMNGKQNFVIYRYHDDAVTAFTKLDSKPESGTEVDATYYVDEENSLIYIYAQKFSTYAIAYTEQSDYVGFGNEENAINVPESISNGLITLTHNTSKRGETVTINVVPENGYELEKLTVTDKNGNLIELTKTGNNTYIFKMPDTSVDISVSFKKVIDTKSPFVDVKPDDYYYDAVLWAVNDGITNGVDYTHFVPTSILTRAQMVTFLWRSAGMPRPTFSRCVFEDVTTDSYSYMALLWGVENNIVKGTSETTFSPNVRVTRGQVVAFMARFAGIDDNAGGYICKFADVSADDYYYNAVSWAESEKIIEGTSEVKFSPNDYCQRGQAITILYRYFAK